jgi:hypothetical protein
MRGLNDNRRLLKLMQRRRRTQAPLKGIEELRVDNSVGVHCGVGLVVAGVVVGV